MMFLQFFVWGSWFSTLYLIFGNHGLSAVLGDAYSSVPMAAIISPLFLGLVADRFFASQKVMGLLLLAGGVFMLMVPGAIAAGNGKLAVWLIAGHMLCFMPTLGLGNTIAFSHVAGEAFPKVRVWGTIGWIVAGLVAGFLGWSASVNLFWMGAAAALLLGAYCFTLPDTPPPSAGKAVSLRALLMVDAFRLLARPAFFVFIICSTLICIPLAYYYANTSGFLQNMGFWQPASAMTIGQMSEIFFLLLVPFFFRRLGVKWMIAIGMAAWLVRYLLFAWGAPEQVVWMLFAGIALHGICYDFFFVVGFMYTDRTAPREVRGQAQGMLVFFTQGVGMWLGYRLADRQLVETREPSAALAEAIGSARGEEVLTFGGQMRQMFEVGMPGSVDPTMVDRVAVLWRDYWMTPAMIAAGVAVLFLVFFRERSEADGESRGDVHG